MATTQHGYPPPKTNRIGLQVLDYRGGKTTLCAGCGHNAISERIIDAMYEMGVQPERVMKLSGIGCSSKSPAYFMSRSHSFNSVHGRMPSVATGALLANKTMRASASAATATPPPSASASSSTSCAAISP
jgi:2-oxoglutarate/2-oxoacid ferredoxin oxidoreductase subunit beta